ncbi:hypothetical protein [Streptosporangium sp. NPDC006007]|uniref:hypothetical protein n=1 Tax=Streptosporangium sp. NPDC006007 TaxID=3154575 RepID=UPI0033ACA73F
MSEIQDIGKEGLAAAPKIWRHIVQPNQAAATAFVNRAPAQGAGEAVFSNRSDGRIDVYFFL